MRCSILAPINNAIEFLTFFKEDLETLEIRYKYVNIPNVEIAVANELAALFEKYRKSGYLNNLRPIYYEVNKNFNGISIQISWQDFLGNL